MSQIIYGKNVINSAIAGKRAIHNCYVTNNFNDKQILTKLREARVNVKVVDKTYLDRLTRNAVHQGIVAEVDRYKFYTLPDLIKQARPNNPLIVILDEIEDPHNLGAILRTADAAGVDGVIIPKRRSAKLTDTVAKVSSGAIEFVRVCEVVNINDAIKELKNNDYWVVGAENDKRSVDYHTLDYNMATVLVIGSEGRGLSRLVKENCDFLVKIPMRGYVNSLNASVSAGILIYEIKK